MTQDSAYFDPRKVVEQRMMDVETQVARLQEEEERQKNIKTGAKAMGTIVGWFLKPAVLMLVWNWIIPSLFGLTTLTYWTAFGLCIITSILFKHDTSSNE
jgi:hypothetical protein